MLRGNLAADLVLNRRSRSAATRRFSFEPIRLASLPLADLGCESGSCLVWGESILPFSPRAWLQGRCAWASRQSAPPEPMLADVACGSDFCFAAAIRARPSIVARVALLRVASLSNQFDSPACRSLTWAARVAFVEYCSIAISVKRILYGPGNLPGPFCLPGRQLRLLKDASKPVAQPRGRFFAIMGQFSGEKI